MGSQFVGLSLLVLLAVAGGLASTPIAFTPGAHYHYKYQTVVKSVLPELSEQHAGHWLESDVHLEVQREGQLNLHMENFRFRRVHLHDEVQHEEGMYQQYKHSREFLQDLELPVQAIYQNGQVVKYVLEEEDNPESANIKRAILQMLQVPHKVSREAIRGPPSNVHDIWEQFNQNFTFFENGIGGICETEYDVLAVEDFFDPEEDYAIITKTRNYQKCVHRAKWEHTDYDHRGCEWVCQDGPEEGPMCEPGCPYGYTWDVSPARGYSVTKYNTSIENGIMTINEIYTEGKISYDISGDTAAIYSNQTLTLVEETQTTHEQIREPTRPRTFKSLQFRIPQVEDVQLWTVDHIYRALLVDYKVQDVEEKVKEVIEYINQYLHYEGKATLKGQKPREMLGNFVLQAINLMSTLPKQSLVNIYSHLDQQKQGNEMHRKIFLELLSECRSLEVAYTIYELVKTGRVDKYEGADLVAGIPMNLVSPNLKVIEMYKELLRQVRNEPHSIVSAYGIALGKLISRVCIKNEKRIQNTLKAYNQGQEEEFRSPYYYHQLRDEPRMPQNRRGGALDDALNQYEPQQNRRVEQDICSPHQLQKYLMEVQEILQVSSDIPQITAYIETLAHTGSPDALELILPYVTEHNDVCKDDDDDDECEYVRKIAIYALHHIVSHDPETVRSIVEPIYFNQTEPSRVRIAAFSVYMFCDPPIRALQRVATELQDEDSDHVGSFVYSALRTTANSSLPCFHKMAQKIKYVFSHLPNYENGIHMAKFLHYDHYDEDDDMGLASFFSYVPDEESHYPETVFFGLMHNLANLINEPLKIGYNAKGLEQLVEKVQQLLQGKKWQQQQQKSSTGYMEKMNIKPRMPEDFQLRLFFKYFENTRHFAYDQKDLDWAVSKLHQILSWSPVMRNEPHHLLKILMPMDHQVIMPTEMGMPAILSNRHPIVFHCMVQFQKDTRDTITVQVKPMIHYESHMYANIINPVMDEVYGVNVEKTFDVCVPFEVELTNAAHQGHMEVVVRPHAPHQVFYHATEPKSFIAKNPNMGSHNDWFGHQEPIRTLDEPVQYEDEMGHDLLGLGLRTTVESENPWSEQWFLFSETAETDGLIPAFIELWRNPGCQYREVNTYLEQHETNPTEEFHFMIHYDTTHSNKKTHSPNLKMSYYDDYESQYNYEQHYKHPYGQHEDQYDSWGHQQRRPGQQNQQTTTYKLDKDTKVSHHLKAKVTLKGGDDETWMLDARYEHSHHGNDSHFVAVAKKESQGRSRYSRQGQDEVEQVCMFYHYETSEQPDEFSLDLQSLQEIEGQMVAAMDWGTTCDNKPAIRITGELSKDEEWYTDVTSTSAPWYYKQCKDDIKNGDSLSYACQEALSDASEFDNLELNITYDEQEVADWFKDFMYDATVYLKKTYYAHLNQTLAVENPEGKIRIEFEFEDILVPLTNITVQTPNENFTLNYVPLEWVPKPSVLDSLVESYIMDVTDDAYPALCTISEDYVTTFDNVTFEMPEGDCEFLLAADCSGKENIAISFKEVDPRENTKIVTIELGSHTVRLHPNEQNADTATVFVNGERWQLEEDQVLRPCVEEDEDCVEIFIQDTLSENERPMVVVRDNDTQFTIVYNGVAIMIYAPMSHQGVQCGICGDFNDEDELDFEGPQECIYEDEEDFAHAYAFPGTCTRDPVMGQGRKRCPHQQTSYGSYRSRQPGMHMREREEHRNPMNINRRERECFVMEHVVERKIRQGQTCFSVQPVKQCQQMEKCASYETKEVQFICLPSDASYTRHLEMEVKQGGNIENLRGKPVEFTRAVKVPTRCKN